MKMFASKLIFLPSAISLRAAQSFFFSSSDTSSSAKSNARSLKSSS